MEETVPPEAAPSQFTIIVHRYADTETFDVACPEFCCRLSGGSTRAELERVVVGLLDEIHELGETGGWQPLERHAPVRRRVAPVPDDGTRTPLYAMWQAAV